MPLEQLPSESFVVLICPFCEPLSVIVVVSLLGPPTVCSETETRLTVGAAGETTVRLIAVFVSSLLNVVFVSFSRFWLPFSSVALKLVDGNEYVPSDDRVVMDDFLNVTVLPSALQLEYARLSEAPSQSWLRSAVTVPVSMFVHPL